MPTTVIPKKQANFCHIALAIREAMPSRCPVSVKAKRIFTEEDRQEQPEQRGNPSCVEYHNEENVRRWINDFDREGICNPIRVELSPDEEYGSNIARNEAEESSPARCGTYTDEFKLAGTRKENRRKPGKKGCSSMSTPWPEPARRRAKNYARTQSEKQTANIPS